MKSCYNFTGRKKLNNADFDVSLYELKDGPSEVEVVIHKRDDLEIPDDAVAWVEAYRGPRSMRFSLGKWCDLKEARRFKLSDFDSGEPLLFRIKVVAEGDRKHPIKAWRDRIRPVTYSATGQKKKSILPVLPCDLGHIAWKIDWTDASRPVLQVNSRINEARDVTSIVKNDPDFAILVFPQVIRDVLTRLLSEGVDEDEDREDNEWLTFGANLAGCEFAGDDGNEEENANLIRDWVESVVQAFGRETDLIKRYSDYKTAS
jgi:hypothetical protein